MPPGLRLRTPNPHLGAYFAIVTSGFASLAILLALLEQIGWQVPTLAAALMLLPVLLYLAIAFAARSRNLDDYFACGRRVPSLYNGLVLAATLIGGAGFFAYTGAVFFLGYDALAIGLGLTFGMLAGTVLFSPYLRKAGAFTVPSFLGQRWRSRSIRLTAAVLLLLPVALLLAAEIKIAAWVAALFLPVAYPVAVLGVTVVICTTAALGGMRSLTWSGSAQFMVCAFALIVPLVIVSVLMTTLPTPQLTYGEQLLPLETAEIDNGISAQRPQPLSEALPQSGPEASSKPFSQDFGAVGRIDFVLLFLGVALGSAALPSLLMRSGVTLSVADQRWAGAWAVLFVAVFAISAPAIAVFAKTLMFQTLSQIRPDALPAWMAQLMAKHLMIVGDTNRSGGLQASEMQIARDGVVLSLPIAAGLPVVCTILVAAGGMAIALAAAGSHLFTLGAGLAEDVYPLIDRSGHTAPRQIAAWAGIAIAAFGAAAFAVVADIDLLQALLIGFSLIGASFFPVLLLAIWWERFTRLGALAAMLAGFGTMAVVLLLHSAFGAGEAGAVMAVMTPLGALIATAAGLGVSLWTPAVSPADESYFEALRDPEGEALYDEARARPGTSPA
jgi:cation/acetate symporter